MILLFIKIYLLTVFSNLLIMTFFLNSKSFIDAYNSFDYNKKLRNYIPIVLALSAFFPIVNIIYLFPVMNKKYIIMMPVRTPHEN